MRATAVSRRVRLLAALALWLGVAGFAWSWAGRHEEGAVAAMEGLLAGAERPGAAFGLLLVGYLLRPVTLLPVTVLTAFCGFLLGPALGFVVALLAVVSTSLLPYWFTRLARGRTTAPRPVRGWTAALNAHPFETILTARLAMLPGDLVNVSAGMLRVPTRPFVAATALGGAPGVLIGVLAGASVQGAFRVEGATVDLPLVLASASLLVVSLTVSRALRRRRTADGAEHTATEAGRRRRRAAPRCGGTATRERR